MNPLPASKDAEKAILSSLLLDAEPLADVMDELKPAHFSNEIYRAVYSGMLNLAVKGMAIDPLTVSDEMEQAGELQRYGGRAAIADLINGQVRSTSIETYVKKVKESWTLRQLAAVGNQIYSLSTEPDSQADDVLANAERMVMGVSDSTTKSRVRRIGDVVRERIAYTKAFSQSGRPASGLLTGFSDLDFLTSGLQPGQLVYLAARTKVGKSALALNLSENVCAHPENNNPAVAFFSLEMSDTSIADRFLCSVARVNSLHYRHGYLGDTEWTAIERAANLIDSWNIELDDCGTQSPMRIASRCRRIRQKYGRLDLVIVDYVQLIASDRSNKNSTRQQEVGQVSRALKELAKALGCPIIALAQLSRRVDERADHRPLLSDLREAGDLEQDADMVWFLHRDKVYDDNADNSAELTLAKHREGPPGTVKMIFLEQFARYEQGMQPWQAHTDVMQHNWQDKPELDEVKF
ncbi:MAG TPA: replicative DNA helicase [Blastocatellia bacterium]|nr:replicative DNA helicase [Blastocatellia bacterium]